MHNYTIEDYKKAIKAKYEIEKENDILSSPSQANLRDFCWEIFVKTTSKDDLSIFSSFFGFEFDLTKRNQFKEHTDRFRPIGTFYKGKTDLSHRDAINLAAILVDFQPRPFKQFKEKGAIWYKKPSGGTRIPEPFAVINEKDEEDEDGHESEEIEEFEYVNDDDKNANWGLTQKNAEETKTIHLFVSFRKKVCRKFTKRVWWTMFVIALVFACGFLISHFVFPEKQCMQWDKDHYEIVDCDLEVNGLFTPNVIEPLDKNRINLQKIKVCDTTTFFKNGQAIVFYAKNGGSVEWFNQMGQNPENKEQYLRPVTNYIIEKYLGNKPCK
jgi:hypothetical protein